MYWLVLLDDYSASFGLMVVVITTCLAVTRVYGEKGAGGEGRQTDTPRSERTGCGPCTAARQGDRHGGGVTGTNGIYHGDTPSPPLCRHPAVLPRHPHDAGLQARPLLQGLLAVSVSSHTLGKQGWEGKWLAGALRPSAGPSVHLVNVGNLASE